MVEGGVGAAAIEEAMVTAVEVISDDLAQIVDPGCDCAVAAGGGRRIVQRCVGIDWHDTGSSVIVSRWHRDPSESNRRGRHAGCGVVSNGCSDAPAASAAISKSSAAPPPPPKPAIACASW